MHRKWSRAIWATLVYGLQLRAKQLDGRKILRENNSQRITLPANRGFVNDLASLLRVTFKSA